MMICAIMAKMIAAGMIPAMSDCVSVGCSMVCLLFVSGDCVLSVAQCK